MTISDAKPLLVGKLQAVSGTRLTGKLVVKAQSDLSWSLYFGLGSLIWIDGGPHPNRSLYRGIRTIFPELTARDLQLSEARKFPCHRYAMLESLYYRKNLDRVRLRTLGLRKFVADLFDICQLEPRHPVTWEWEDKTRRALYEMGLRSSLFVLQTAEICSKVNSFLSTWKQQEYSSWSPNLAPMLGQKERLRQIASADAYRNLVQLVDGNRTLYDLADRLGTEVGRVALSLLPYIRGGYIDLVEVPDLQEDVSQIAAFLARREAAKVPAEKLPRPLIGCIDDSLQVCRIMQLVLNEAGYDCISVQDSLMAVSTFIERTPDLIFLDLNMPVVNGYEICSQLRRVTKLKDVPIVILTGKDGIIDRVRSKVVGASGFMAKPIDSSKVVLTVHRMLAGDRTFSD